MPRILLVSTVYLLGVILTSVMLFEQNPALVQFFAVVALILLVVTLYLSKSVSPCLNLNKCLNNNQSNNVNTNAPDKLCSDWLHKQYFLKELTLLPDALVEFDKKQYQLHLNSRVGLLGCWLCLTSQHNEKTNSKVKPKIRTKTHFIYKNSVSKVHYAQLCRVIKRNTFRDD